MKTASCLLPLFASCALADEIADRAAIGRVIAALNERPARIAQIGESPAAARELEALMRPREVWNPNPGSPHVTISHEPWGEATINYPATAPSRSRQCQMLMPSRPREQAVLV